MYESELYYNVMNKFNIYLQIYITILVCYVTFKCGYGSELFWWVKCYESTASYGTNDSNTTNAGI